MTARGPALEWTTAVTLSVLLVAGCSTRGAVSPPSRNPLLSVDYFSVQRRHLSGHEGQFVWCPYREEGEDDGERLSRRRIFDNLPAELRIPSNATCQFRLVDYEPEQTDDSDDVSPGLGYDFSAGRDEEETRRLREDEAEQRARAALEVHVRWTYSTSRGAMDVRSNGVVNVYALTRPEPAVADHAWELAREMCPRSAFRAEGERAFKVALLPASAEGVPFYIQDVDAEGLAPQIPQPYSSDWATGCVRGGLLSGRRLVIVSYNNPLPGDWGYSPVAGRKTTQSAPWPFHPTRAELTAWQSAQIRRDAAK